MAQEHDKQGNFRVTEPWIHTGDKLYHDSDVTRMDKENQEKII